MTKEEVKQYEELEEKRMLANSWAISKELEQRIDDAHASVLSERIKAYLSEDKDELFFFNQHYLTQYQAATSEVSMMKVPGSSYFAKIDQFITTHYKIGEPPFPGVFEVPLQECWSLLPVLWCMEWAWNGINSTTCPRCK